MKKILAIAAFALVAASITVPLLASADSLSPNYDIWNPNIIAGPLRVCVGAAPTDSSGNPVVGPTIPVCSNLCDLVAQFLNIIYYVIGFVIWIIVPIDVAIGGIMYMLAGADPGMTTKAKAILTGAVWAIAITLCSYIIVATFVSVMKISGVGGFNDDTCHVVTSVSS